MITPAQIAKSGSESAHQKAFFAYCAVARHKGFAIADVWASSGNLFKTALDKPIYALEWIHHIPNGGKRDKRTGSNLKAEGVKPGVADVFLPYPIFDKRGHWLSGLYIEMKRPSEKPKSSTTKGGLKPKQIEFKEYCERVGYKHEVCYSWEEAVTALKGYLNQ